MDTLAALAPAPGHLTLGGITFTVLPPTPGDMIRTGDKMKELARAKCAGPLDYVVRNSATLPPAMLALAVAEAIKLGAGGGVEPTIESVWEQYTTLEGVRWRVWYHVSRVLPDFTPEAAAALVTDDNRLDAAEQLDAALKLKAADPKGPAPATGSG